MATENLQLLEPAHRGVAAAGELTERVARQQAGHGKSLDGGEGIVKRELRYGLRET